jgi:hypothetical protein
VRPEETVLDLYGRECDETGVLVVSVKPPVVLVAGNGLSEVATISPPLNLSISALFALAAAFAGL